MDNIQDIFVSHADADKQNYINSLTGTLTAYGITFWLDNFEIGWGDNFVLKINEGLRSSQFVLLCLSKNFLLRPWTENEMSSVLAIQNADGKKRALPLILNSKDEVFKTYPLLSSLSYKEYSIGVDSLAKELSQILKKKPNDAADLLEVIIKSAHTGQLCNLKVSPQVSVQWLAAKAQDGLGLKDEADIGGFVPFRVRFVLVDVQAEDEWKQMPRGKKQEVYAIVKTDEGFNYSFDGYDPVEKLQLGKKTIFHLYAIEDINYEPTEACAANSNF